MTTQARKTARTLADFAGDVPAPGALLDWRHHLHYQWPAPCVLCRRPTPLRSHDGEAAHKVCAEQWITAHNTEALRTHRFVSDRRTTSKPNQHA
ncbi:hypothetical protein F8R89_01135 [Streptomyces sp. SS1-1]|uniref:hypothetical protein n=1 Tax=Streptomyces sp. SS1-1 TaxID=2651869 RepID=UPI00125046FE|nr:hypothetical protein [Streptomyces sp. SS1-1]KAB2977472.1 hypothetical protein F8R89_01135 [Streptomyces sp. SS1-1]